MYNNEYFIKAMKEPMTPDIIKKFSEIFKKLKNNLYYIHTFQEKYMKEYEPHSQFFDKIPEMHSLCNGEEKKTFFNSHSNVSYNHKKEKAVAQLYVIYFKNYSILLEKKVLICSM